MFDFYRYAEVFNSGDDKAMVEGFWADELAVMSARDGKVNTLAENKVAWLDFLAFAHNGVREIMRIQTLIQEEKQIFAEIDMDFHIFKDRADYPFGAVKSGDFFTVKMFALYFLKDDKIRTLKMASWPPNAGVTDPPVRSFGPPPPIDKGGVRKAF